MGIFWFCVGLLIFGLFLEWFCTILGGEFEKAIEGTEKMVDCRCGWNAGGRKWKFCGRCGRDLLSAAMSFDDGRC